MGRDGDPTAKTAVAEISPPKQRSRAVLTVTGGDDVGRVIPLTARRVTLGRSDECAVRFQDAGLSRMHAEVCHVADDYVLKDLGSTNGSFVDDVRVDFAVTLKDGDRVRLGSTVSLRFALVDDQEERAMQRMFEASRRDGIIAAFRRLDEGAESLEEDLLQARDFQRRALPEPPRLPGVEIDVIYRPLDLVGGDLHHVSSPGERKLRVFLADSTGHGVKASLTTMLILSEYEPLKRRPDPGALLAELNERITSAYAHLGLRFTATCVDLDFVAKEARHASAAHPSPLLLRGGDVIELGATGTFVGLVPGATFPTMRLPLERGDQIVVFTDGATEQWSPSGEAFGEQRLADVVSNAPRGGQVSHRVEAALEAFVSPGRALADDATVIVVTWTGDP